MNLINELRTLAEDLYVNGYNRYSSAMSQAADELAKWKAVFGHLGDTPDECGNAIITARNELEERLEAAESTRRDDYQNWITALDRNAELLAKLEAAEKEIALKERLIDARGSSLNAVANERDALRTVLTDLLNDLEERAKWNLEASQRVVACGNGVYVRAKAALEKSK